MKTLLGSSVVLISALFASLSAFAVASGAEKAAAIKAHQIICAENSANDSEDGSDSVILSKITVQLDLAGKAISLKIDRPASDGLAEVHSLFTTENDSITHTVEEQDVDYTNINEVETVLARNQSGDVVHLKVNDHTYAGWAGSTLEIAFGGKTFSTSEAAKTVSCTGQVKFNVGNDSGADIGEGDDGELLP